MVGGFSRPKKDRGVKVSTGQSVKTGQILIRGKSAYKAGINVKGSATIFALCSGNIYFSKKKTSGGKVRTFVNIRPDTKKTDA